MFDQHVWSVWMGLYDDNKNSNNNNDNSNDNNSNRISICHWMVTSQIGNNFAHVLSKLGQGNSLEFWEHVCKVF